MTESKSNFEGSKLRRLAVWGALGLVLLVIILGWMGWKFLHRDLNESVAVVPESLVSRRYEVSGILFALRSGDAEHLPQSADGLGGNQPADAKQRALWLVEMLRKAVPNDEWACEIDGKDFSSVGLNITAMPAVQEELERAIGQIRNDRSAFVDVHVGAMAIDVADLKKLSFELPKLGGPMKYAVLPEYQRRQLVHICKYAWEFGNTLLNHEDGRVDSETTKEFIASYVKDPGGNGGVHYQARKATALDYAVHSKTRPTVSEDHRTITVAVQLDFSHLTQMEKAFQDDDHNLPIEIPHEFHLNVVKSVTIRMGETAIFAARLDERFNRAYFVWIKAVLSKPGRSTTQRRAQ